MKSLGRGFAGLSLEDEDNYWDEEMEYGDSAGYEDAEAEGDRFGADEREENLQNVAGEVCAICLSAIEPEDLAIIKGCEHEYCVNCILQWATCKEAPWCPQCKKPFNYLYCHRLLDGGLSDAPVEESVCLLKRASWFVEHVKTLEKGKAVSAAMAAEEFPHEWVEGYQGYYDEDEDGYDEDEQIEKYYFSSAAGHARVVLGNRRLGENGYMRAGRMYARPANSNSSQPSGSGIGKAGKGRTPGGKPGLDGNSTSGAGGSSSGAGASSSEPGANSSGACANGSGDAGGSGAGPSSSSATLAAGSSPAVKGQGRRAKRNARRAATDLEI